METGRRPVMVWLHGGGFRTGSGNSVFYDGQQLARKHGAVVVTLTHRLNALGFLHLAGIRREIPVIPPMWECRIS